MKGQKLFVRPIDGTDHDAVRGFLLREDATGPIPVCGLLAKLVGDIVGVVAMQITPDAVQIDNIVVARDVRKKRIGRYLVDEVGQIASRIDRPHLVAEGCTGADEFFRRIGFEREGSRWIRRL
jgi:N-acetylglutamate synthase-like GNAT family acetyltransferase